LIRIAFCQTNRLSVLLERAEKEICFSMANGLFKTKMVPDLCPTTIKILTHLLSRYHLPLISEFRNNIENEKHIIGFKSLTVHDKKNKKQSSIFDIINTSCNFQQNRSKEVVMDITGHC
jgi:hypothetical protein